jgi:hypothetical protein
MRPKNLMSLEGFVWDCCYSNFVNRDFPDSCISLDIKAEKSGDRIKYFIIGKNKPPINIGLYVKGFYYQKELVEEKDGSIFVIDNLDVFDKERTDILFRYECNS